MKSQNQPRCPGQCRQPMWWDFENDEYRVRSMGDQAKTKPNRQVVLSGLTEVNPPIALTCPNCRTVLAFRYENYSGCGLYVPEDIALNTDWEDFQFVSDEETLLPYNRIHGGKR